MVSLFLILAFQKPFAHADPESVLIKNIDIIDGTGKTVIPGLIDTHTHLHSVPGNVIKDGIPKPPFEWLNRTKSTKKIGFEL